MESASLIQYLPNFPPKPRPVPPTHPLLSGQDFIQEKLTQKGRNHCRSCSINVWGFLDDLSNVFYKKNKGERWRLWKIRKYWIWGCCEGNNDKYVDKYQTVHFRNKVPLSSLAD